MINCKLLLIALTLLCSSVVWSQSIFKVPIAESKYEEYRNIDDCLAAYDRLYKMWSATDTIWRDTATFDSVTFYRELPKNSIDIIKRCISRINFDTLPIDRAGEWVALLLAAGRDADAKGIYARWINEKEGSFHGSQFTGILNSMANAVPSRRSMIVDLYDLIDKSNKIDSLASAIRVRQDIALALWSMGGSNSLLKKLSAELDSITNSDPTIKEDPGYINGNIAFKSWAIALRAESDSALKLLSKSTDLYVAYAENKWMRYAFGKSELNSKLSDTIPADFWYGPTSTNPLYTKVTPSPHISKGVMNLIISIQGSCHAFRMPQDEGDGRSNNQGVIRQQMGESESCWSSFATLRRIASRFPDVKITIVTKTYGILGAGIIHDPSNEADTLARWLLAFHKLPATVAIGATEFIRVSGLDRRRVDDWGSTYQLGNMPLLRVKYILTDKNKRIISTGLGLPSKINEREFLQLIQTVYDRE